MTTNLTEQALGNQLRTLRRVGRIRAAVHLLFLLCLTATIVVLTLYAELFPPLGMDLRQPILWLLPVYFVIVSLSLLLTVAIHELGHLLCAWHARYYIAMVWVGPFAWTCTHSGHRFRFMWKNAILFAGAVLGGPLDNNHLRQRHGWVILGGLLANLLWFLLLSILRALLPPMPELNWIQILLDIAALIAFLIFFTSLIPYRMAGVASDGWQLLSLWRNDSSVMPWLQSIVVGTQLLSGIRPRELPTEHINQLLVEPTHNSSTVPMALLAFYRALDADDIKSAKDYLALALKHKAQFTYPQVLLAVAHYNAIIPKDSTESWRWLQLYQAQMATVPAFTEHLFAVELQQFYYHIKAQLFLIDGNTTAAIDAAKKSLTLLNQIISIGDVHWQQPHLEAILQEAESSHPSSAANPVGVDRANGTQGYVIPRHPFVITTVASLLGPCLFVTFCFMVTAWDLNSSIRSSIHGTLAARHLARDEFLQAINQYTKAIKLLPTRPRDYLFRGEAYLEQKDYLHAIDDFTYVITHGSPDAKQAYLWRGYAYYQLGDILQGNDDLQQVLRLSADNAHADNWRRAVANVYKEVGMNAYNQGSSHTAITTLTLSLNLEPNQPYLHWFRGAAYVAQGRFHRAVEDYNQAIAVLGKENPSLYEYRGDAYGYLGQYEKAVEDYDQMLAGTAVEDAQTYFQRGKFRFHAKQYEAALTDFVHATSLQSDEPLIPIYMGLSHAHLHEFAAGQRAFQGSQDSEAGLALQRLGMLLIEGQNVTQSRVEDVVGRIVDGKKQIY